MTFRDRLPFASRLPSASSSLGTDQNSGNSSPISTNSPFRIFVASFRRNWWDTLAHIHRSCRDGVARWRRFASIAVTDVSLGGSCLEAVPGGVPSTRGIAFRASWCRHRAQPYMMYQSSALNLIHPVY